MKKQLAITLGLAVIATPALATKARLEALGEDANGSFYIADNRNIFLNASTVNDNKDLVTYEFGAAGAAGDATAPNAEGGFIINAGSLVYGAQMGRDNGYNAGISSVAGTFGGANAQYKASNALDLFVGGDNGVKWGADLYYSSQKSDAFVADTVSDSVQAKVMDLNVGIQTGALAAFVKMGVNGKTTYDASDVDGDIKRKSDMTVGASYKHMDITFFGQMASNKYVSDTAVSTEEIKNSSMSLGAAKTYKLNDKANLFAKVSYNTSKNTVDSTDVDTKTKTLPVVVGLEHDAASWLTLRGSISQEVMGNTDVDGDKSTNLNTTKVAAGASLKFGDLSVDGLISNGSNANTAGTGTNTAGGNGNLRTDNLMSRVSMTYKF